MEDYSSSHVGPGHWIPPSFSKVSLDVGQLIGVSAARSLMSESVTLESFSTESSDTLPAFPLCKLPTVAMIGLGDHLKMFSTVATLTQEMSTPNFRVSLAAPTLPRLRSMHKECLSIIKWAEHSTGWKAPGHVPWECVQEGNAAKWIPEGSLFSPESFSCALSQARAWPDDSPYRPALPTILKSSAQQENTLDATPPKTTPDFTDAELLGRMRELKGFKFFFEEVHNGSDVNNVDPAPPGETSPLLPSLVVSNSRFTFPLALDSSQSISQHNPVTLAYRRGKRAPAPLLLWKQDTPSDISYPGIPTAFLGSPSGKFSDLPAVDTFDADSEKPTMPVEEMINNLRLQCSTMSLRTPPIDPSWNSRSTLESLAEPGHSNKARSMIDTDEWAFANGLLEELEPVMLPVTSLPARPRLKPLEYQIKGPSSIAITRRVRKAPHVKYIRNSIELKAPKASVIMGRPAWASSREVRTPQKTALSLKLQRDIPDPHSLRSAMVKDHNSHPKKPFKCVRFALPRRDPIALGKFPDLKDGLGSSLKTVASEAKLKEEVQKAPPSHKSDVHVGTTKVPLLFRSTSLVRLKPKEPIATKIIVRKRLNPVQAKPRAHSVTISSPLRQIAIDKPSIQPEARNTPTHRRAENLGRHSLDRIIKGPIFGIMGNKRATISIATSLDLRCNENSVRREILSDAAVLKKSRMPIPLRNILTRFK